MSPLFFFSGDRRHFHAEQSEGRKGKGLAGFNTSFSVSMRREEGRRDTGNEVGAVAGNGAFLERESETNANEPTNPNGLGSPEGGREPRTHCTGIG